MSMPKGADEVVFCVKGAYFKLFEVHYFAENDEVNFVLQRIHPGNGTEEVDATWLVRLAGSLLSDRRPEVPKSWDKIEFHLAVPTPWIRFCHS